jgi:signal transduction histidine kinase
MAEPMVDRAVSAFLGWSREWPAPLVDAMLALAIAAAAVVADAVAREPSGRGADAFAYGVIVVASGVLVLRRRNPALVFAVTLGAGLIYFSFGYPRAPALGPFVIAVYNVAVTETRRRSLSLVIGGLAALAVAAFATDHGSDVGPPTLLWVAAWLLGGWLVSGGRARRAQAREAHSRRMVDAERLRIARELHDVVAHSIATINIQAGVAAHVIEQQPEQAAIAFQAIKASSREALRELRGILSVLRSVDDEADPRAPEPGLDRLEALVQTTGEAGLPVKLALRGRLRPLPRTVEAAAYRIVQESLTNVLRHAGPARAVVAVTYEERDLVLEVSDNGIGKANGSVEGAGLGIAGMRERAAAFGGELEAGALPLGGFRVRAVLPVDGSR